MAGTPSGGKKAAQANVERYGKDFYRAIGKRGGANGKGPWYNGGFASDIVGKDGLTGPQRALIAGAKGGRISRRRPSKKQLEIKEQIQHDLDVA